MCLPFSRSAHYARQCRGQPLDAPIAERLENERRITICVPRAIGDRLDAEATARRIPISQLARELVLRALQERDD